MGKAHGTDHESAQRGKCFCTPVCALILDCIRQVAWLLCDFLSCDPDLKSSQVLPPPPAQDDEGTIHFRVQKHGLLMTMHTVLKFLLSPITPCTVTVIGT